MVEFRYKVEREVQFPMLNYMNSYKKSLREIYKRKQMFGGGQSSTDALSSVATILNREDYNIKSMGVL